VENSPMLTSRGLGRVLGDLAEMGFDAEWGVLGAGDFKAPHQRDRIWIVANRDRNRLHDTVKNNSIVFKRSIREDEQDIGARVWCEAERCLSFDDWKTYASEFYRVGDGVADRMDRLKAAGNGQVSFVAAKAWEILSDQR
jgi:DNA (cytosine-5)-methyltransferase 1